MRAASFTSRRRTEQADSKAPAAAGVEATSKTSRARSALYSSERPASFQGFQLWEECVVKGQSDWHSLAKISQEVRDFAAKQNQSADSFLAANPPRNGEGDQPQAGGGGSPLDAASAEAGMQEMSEKFREKGGEIYLPAK